MAAALLWVRTNLRSQWRSAALVILIAGLCSGVTMAAIAGARRTTTSFTRFVRDSKEMQIFVAAPDQKTGDLAADVLRRSVDPDLVVEAVFLAAKPNTIDKGEEFDIQVVGDVKDTMGRTVMLPKVIEGGAANGARDVALNDLAAETLRVGPGDLLDMVGYSPAAFEACSTGAAACVADVNLGEVTVTGIYRSPDDVAPESRGSMTIVLSATLMQSWLPLVASQMWLSGAHVDSPDARAALGTALTDAIGSDRVSGPAADVFLETDSEGDPGRVSGALDVEHNGLLILGLLAGLAGLVAVPQALARHRAAASTDDFRLQALGWTRRDQLRSSVIWSLLLGVAAGLVAVVAAIAMSPLFPIGLARLAEPSPGVHADWLVLTMGALSTVAVMLGAAWLVSFGRDRAHATRPSRLARLFAASRPVPSTAGRFLLEGGRLSPIARTALSAAALGVAAIACAATVIRSQDYLVARPQLYGAPWDFQGRLSGETPDPELLAGLNRDPSVAASAVLTGGRVDADGQQIAAVAIEPLKGSIQPTILSGRTVLHEGEIVLSSGFLESHHLQVGDSVPVGSPDESGSLTIVGSGVPVAVGSYGGDVGAVMMPADYGRYGIATSIEGEGGVELAVRLVPGSDSTAMRSRVAEITGGFYQAIDTSFRPARIMNFSRVRSVPQLITAFAALLTLLVLVHSLAMVASRRRHDLSVLRALGLQSKQARRVLWWHGGILAVIAVAIGLPLGVVGGRLLWRAVADSIQSVYSPHAPWMALVVFALGLCAISVSAGAALSIRAVPRSIAPQLRSE